MIDLHSHVLHGIDDGSRSIEESLDMVRSAMELGFRGIVCTSHYKTGRAENLNYIERFQELKEAIKKENLELELYPGNEMFLGMEEIEALKDGKINTYNKTKYILVELDPMMPFPPVRIALERIVNMGYVPLLAHIERYRDIKISEFLKLREMGVFFQINIPSLRNGYRDKVVKFLELGLVDLFTSDAHRSDRRTYFLQEELREINELVGEGNFEKMCEDTVKVVRGEKITPMTFRAPEKKSLFGRIMRKIKKLGKN